MNKRQSVMKAVELHSDATRERSCSECPYEHDDSCLETVFDDMLELLKEQEPVEPDGDNCGECGYTLHRINYDGPGKELRHEWFRFCPSCGRMVKWDE